MDKKLRTLLAWMTLSVSAFAQVGINSGVVSTHVLTAPPPACLLSGYPMNEGSGVTFIDAAGVANINMPAGSLVWSTLNTGFLGIETAYYSGIGTGTFANFTNTNFTGTTPFSVSLWRGMGSNGAWVSSINPSASYRGWEFGISADAPNLYLVNSLGSNEIQVTSTTNLPGTFPEYIVFTYDGSQTAAGVSMYINGSAVGTSVAENNLSATIASGIDSAFAIRVDGTTPSTGVIADLEIYNCVLSSTRVAANYALGPGIN